MTNKRPGEPSDWELEKELDLGATFEDLLASSPFTKSSDEQGRSETVGTRVPTWLLRRIIKLKELKGSPYELNSDVLRDAIFLGMRILHIRYRIGQEWSVETKLASIADATGAARRIREQIDELISGLDDLVKDDDETQAAEKLSDYVVAANDLENEWHKKKIFKLLHDNRTVCSVAELCPKAVRDLILGGKEKKRNG